MAQNLGLLTKEEDEKIAYLNSSREKVDSFYFDLKSVKHSSFPAHIRISLVNQIIDIFSEDNVRFKGVLTNYIRELRTVKKSEKRIFLFEKVILSQEAVDSVFRQFVASKQFDIPTDSLIQGWNNNFLHCKSLVIQSFFNSKYLNSEFRCPLEQSDSLEFIHTIQTNYALIRTQFYLDSLYSSFVRKLPKGKTYLTDEYSIYKMTDKMHGSWKKTEPMRKYLKSVKDSIDNYLELTLSKKKIDLNGLDCFEDYEIVFSKNGSLKKIKVLNYYKPKLKSSYGLKDFLAEKKEIRKCEQIIKNVLKDAQLDFLQKRYSIHRTISFDHKGEFHLGDDMLY